MRGVAAEQFDHPPGAGADIDQPPNRPVAEGVGDRLLDLAFGDMERADVVPGSGMKREIARCGLGPVGANRLQPPDVGGELGLRLGPAPAIDRIEQGSCPVGVGQHQEHPAALLAPRDQPAVGKDADMARNTRLALPEQLRQLTDRQFHRPQQRENPQPTGIGKRLEKRRERCKRGHQSNI